jgi:hypothetical protein
MNSRNPHWTKVVLVPYKFEERQLLRFQVYYKNPNHEEVGLLPCNSRLARYVYVLLSQCRNS